MYYIQNLNAGFLGNSPVFWSKNGGYSQWLDEAIDSIAKRTVDIQDMRKLPCLKNSEYSDE